MPLFPLLAIRELTLHQIRSKKGHFITGDLGAFDAPFFSVNAAEAIGMDPQQRGLLETTYQALENGITSPAYQI